MIATPNGPTAAYYYSSARSLLAMNRLKKPIAYNMSLWSEVKCVCFVLFKRRAKISSLFVCVCI